MKVIKENDDKIITRNTKLTQPVRQGSTPIGYRVKNESGKVRFFFEKNVIKGLLGSTAVSDLKEMRKLGFLKGEGGAQPRLLSKAPKYIPTDERVYELILPAEMLE